MNNLKKTLLVGILLFTTIFYGQRRPDREKIKTLKVAFITDRLDLSSSEAEAFWPVYNAHEEQMNSFRKTERSEIRTKIKSDDPLSNQEAEKLLEQWTRLEEQKQKEQKTYFSKMKNIITAKKTILLIKTEEDFKRQLIKQYRQKRSGGGYR